MFCWLKVKQVKPLVLIMKSLDFRHIPDIDTHDIFGGTVSPIISRSFTSRSCKLFLGYLSTAVFPTVSVEVSISESQREPFALSLEAFEAFEAFTPKTPLTPS